MVKKLKIIRQAGGVLNRKVAIQIGKKEAMARDPGNHYRYSNLGKGWARSLFNRMNMTFRAATTGKLPMPTTLVEEERLSFTNTIAQSISQHNIPASMVLNFDQTPLLYCPAGKFTMAEKGSSKVPIAGKADKRAMTAVFTVSMAGKFLPPQLIYPGKTARSLPEFQFPASFHVTCNPNHWSNEETMCQYTEQILKPYFADQRAEHGDVPGLVIFDRFKAHLTASFTETLQKLNLIAVLVPANMTDFLQPLDLSVNKSAKDYFSDLFHDWYSHEIGEIDVQSQEYDEKIRDVLKSSVSLRNRSAEWMVSLYNHYQLSPQKEIIVNGFRAAGITERVETGPINDDPFSDIAEVMLTD